ncbi:Thiosulfate sulfurtransferase RDL2, mitochondrial [Erysiphe neolycopersici]|uniref:Thiosulfate sulfurtransferase RDL2, mitochondrial n=1 Tax=Erysiphe neolycopersici TaxID=212602 RepID=A0A420HIZ9_9PEZI|nr:Thiosulfate sulfurtransferase RDL2, mitochondrial [Erysiphe neolycopersici]
MIDARRLSRPYTTSDNPESSEGTIKYYNFSDIKELIKAPPSSTRALIDVRENNELYHHGTIPGSLNIPLNSFPEVFTITADEFERLVGFTRPKKDVELIFFCHAGIRSFQAAFRAKMAGWSHVGNYSGGWVDWTENRGKVLKVNPPELMTGKET